MSLKKCPCCEKITLDAESLYEVCSNCGWEDDPIQKDDPDFPGGANEMSLNQARKAYQKEREGV